MEFYIRDIKQENSIKIFRSLWTKKKGWWWWKYEYYRRLRMKFWGNCNGKRRKIVAIIITVKISILKSQSLQCKNLTWKKRNQKITEIVGARFCYLAHITNYQEYTAISRNSVYFLSLIFFTDFFCLQLPEVIFWRCSVKKVFLKTSQKLQEKNCVGASF